MKLPMRNSWPKRRAKWAVTLPVIWFSATASGNIICTGPVNYLGVDMVGQVIVANTATTIHTICSTTTQGSFQVNTQACRMFYATLLANRLASRTITLYYNDPALTSCGQIGAWSTQPSAYFVEQPGN